jgi:hypothetical protein
MVTPNFVNLNHSSCAIPFSMLQPFILGPASSQQTLRNGLYDNNFVGAYSIPPGQQASVTFSNFTERGNGLVVPVMSRRLCAGL